MSRKIFIILTAILLIFFAFINYADHFVKNPLPLQQLQVGGANLLVDVADTPEKRERGLSGRSNLADNQGMLFVFNSSLVPGFWMKDMHFSLDMIWIDQNWTIVGVTKNIPPSSYPQTFQPPSPILYTIEVNAGWADRNKISVGEKISPVYR